VAGFIEGERERKSQGGRGRWPVMAAAVTSIDGERGSGGEEGPSAAVSGAGRQVIRRSREGADGPARRGRTHWRGVGHGSSWMKGKGLGVARPSVGERRGSGGWAYMGRIDRFG
jgi:hypothetical protein